MRRGLAALALLGAVGCDSPPPEPASDWSFLDADLVAVDVLSRDHARLATAEGRVFETRDGGTHWQSLPPGVRVVPPAVERFESDRVQLPFEPQSFEWRDGETELDRAARDRLAEWATAASTWPGLVFEVEARASADEIDRRLAEGEAIRLFEVLEARLSEGRGVLEEAGIAPEAVRIEAAPPWELEERIDEEPGLVAGYFAGRRSERASLRVTAREARRVLAVVLAPAGDPRGLAVGEHGAVWTTRDRGARWSAQPPPVEASLLAAVRLGDEWLAVDADGGLHRSRDDARSWQPVAGASQEGPALRAIDFAPDGALGLAVGDRGRVEVRRAGRPGWQRLVRPSPVSARP